MDWIEFFKMGGYALYVWGAYGATTLLLAIELVQLVRRRRALIEQLRQLRKMGNG